MDSEFENHLTEAEKFLLKSCVSGDTKIVLLETIGDLRKALAGFVEVGTEIQKSGRGCVLLNARLVNARMLLKSDPNPPKKREGER